MGDTCNNEPASGQEPGTRVDTDAPDIWRSSVEALWRDLADGVPPEGRAFLAQAVEQGKVFLELANGVSDHAAGGPRGEALWRQPLALWQQAAAHMLASTPAAGGANEALRSYQDALLEYNGALREVGERTLADVAEAWRTRRGSAPSPAGLRNLFDLYVDLGERRYQALVSSPAFTQISGRLINALVACVRSARAGPPATGEADGERGASRTPPDTSASQAEAATLADVSQLLAGLGLGVEQTLTELRTFGEKLNAGVATLRKIGAIEVGACEKDIIHEDGKLRLYRFEPTTAVTNRVPVLIVYALANRPYMMDLQPQRSLVRGLLDRGLDVYLIDWGYPDAEDRNLGLSDYIDGYMDDCVERLRRRHGQDRINLLGVCQGGTFSLCYSALNPEKIRNLVLMVTPVDFHTPDNLLTAWLRDVDVDAMVDALGNIPGELLNWAFVSMKPLRLTGQKYLDMLDLLDDEEKAGTFLRMEKWIHDSPAQAGECFRQFAKDLFQQNKLVEGTLSIGGRDVRLERIDMPVLNVFAAQDHIVPPAATLALERHIASSDYTTYEFQGGHIGIYVSAKAQQGVPDRIAEWLHARCETEPRPSP